MLGNFSSIRSNPAHNNQQIKHHIKLIFIYYASFADRNNYHLLKHQNYRRFLIDSEIVKSSHQFPQYDILFKKISKGNYNAVNFDQFLKLLTELAGFVYQEDIKQAAFKKFIKNDVKRLEVQIRDSSEFGQDLTLIQTFLSKKPTAQDINIAHKLQESSIIKKCYSYYISSTSMHQKSPSDTFQSFYKFLKDFQISPQLIYKTICYVAFISLLNSRSEQKRNQFQMQSFVKMIILLSEIITKKQYRIEEGYLCSTGRLCKILEKMEVSTGFEKISKLVKGETYFSMSLVRMVMGEGGILPDKDHCLQEMEHSLERGSAGLTRHKICSLPGQVQKTLNTSYQSLNTLANEPQQFKLIKKIFEDLCAYGQVGNNKTLKSMKIKKLYIQAGLLKAISQVWLDLTITELTRQSSSGKIEFPQFVQLLNETARKLQVGQNQVFNLIINCSKDSLLQGQLVNEESAHLAYNQQEVSQLMQMLETISYPLERVFHFYSKSKNQISFAEMTKLMYDFEVFPSILTKSKLYQLFVECYEEFKQKLSQLGKSHTDNFFKNKSNLSNKLQFPKQYSSNLSPKNSRNQKNLQNTYRDQKLLHITAFPVLLLKASNEICEQGLTAAQKIIILLQKMHESKGQQKVVMGKGSIVSQLRKKYAHVYKMSFGPKQSRKQIPEQTVEDLLDTISEY